MFENKLCLQNVLLTIILQYVPEGSGSWKYNHYFPVDEVTRKICFISESYQQHLLDCSKLLGSNQLVTYVPNYEEIFDNENPEEQYCIANILMANLRKKTELLEDK